MELAVIADEITAIGWRLAGARVYLPPPGSVGECLRAAGQSADLILLTAELARTVPGVELEEALLAAVPLLLVIPDLQHTREPPDIEREAQRALGIAT
jgi:vacuolar-type H+-ATPase subunit F/Vma7